MGVRQTKTDLNGQSFHLCEWGPSEATPIVMLHGFPEYSGAWGELAASLPEFRVIAPDQRGYGQSWCPPERSAYRTGNLVADMVALIEGIGAPLILLGHDWGAAVAYAVAITHPELVSHLIILNGVHPGPFQRALAGGGAQTRASQYIHWLRAAGSEDKLAENDFSLLRRMFAEGMDMSWLHGDLLDLYIEAWARPGRMKAMVDWYRMSPLAIGAPGEVVVDAPAYPPAKFRVRMPHLLVWGIEDSALLPEAIAGLGDYCDDLAVRRIAGCDHWLHHQRPDTVADTIRAWLSSKT